MIHIPDWFGWASDFKGSKVRTHCNARLKTLYLDLWTCDFVNKRQTDTCHKNWESPGGILHLKTNQAVQVVGAFLGDDITIMVRQHLYEPRLLTTIQEVLLVTSLLVCAAIM